MDIESARKAVEAASMKKTQVYQNTNDAGQRAKADQAVQDAYKAQMDAHNAAANVPNVPAKEAPPKSAWQLLTGQ